LNKHHPGSQCWPDIKPFVTNSMLLTQSKRLRFTLATYPILTGKPPRRGKSSASYHDRPSRR